MSKTQLSAEERIAKPAEWELFEFAIPGTGKVHVANLGYGEAEARKHTYTVTVDVANESATGCICPANRHRAGACKHRRAVEAQAAVLAVAAPEIDGTPPKREKPRISKLWPA